MRARVRWRQAVGGRRGVGAEVFEFGHQAALGGVDPGEFGGQFGGAGGAAAVGVGVGVGGGDEGGQVGGAAVAEHVVIEEAADASEQDVFAGGDG